MQLGRLSSEEKTFKINLHSDWHKNRYNKVGKAPQQYFGWIRAGKLSSPTKMLLLDFQASHIKPHRYSALQYLQGDWITRKTFPREDWKKAVQDHFFVACPPGHGYDTHRLWEVLIAGSLPVVISTPMDSMYDNLPVVIVQNWSQMTYNFLKNEKSKFEDRSDFLPEKLFFTYWQNLVANI